MRTIQRRLCLSIVWLLIMLSYAYTAEIKFDGGEAKKYASEHCGTGTPPDTGYNTDPKKDIAYVDESPSDCANFASQAMINGGLDFSCVKDANPIGTGKKNKGEKGEINVKDKTENGKTYKGLLTHLTENFCFEVITDHTKAQAGDILSSKDSSHVVIYSGEEKTIVEDPKTKRPAYYGHTKDRCNEATDTWEKWTIYHFKDNDKCKKCERDEKTCKATPKGLCNQCSTCDAATGACKSKCDVPIGSGRCSSNTKCKVIGALGFTMCVNYGPGGDCPDDTFTVGTSTPSDNKAVYPSESAPVGVLDNGYPYDMLKVLETFGQEARLISIDGVDPNLVTEMPVLIIPTAGLMDISDSEFFKASLNEYVIRGGTVVVFAQQQGYEFSAIPGGLSGYGWTEDQSCQTYSAYIDTWHQMLAGQTASIPSINIDGYFTSYPENTTVLLRRTANGQPALITYPYENGRIIATSAYTDYAYTSNQASADEIKLIRDIISWAVKPEMLTEIKPGETVTVNLNITNNDATETATAVEVEILDPDRKERKLWESIPITLAPGQSAQIPITYTTALTDPLGIYHIKYNLMAEGWQLLTSELDPEGTYLWLPYQLQPPQEEPSGRFVVSNPPQAIKGSDINFAVNSNSEHYLNGSNATFTVTIWNSGNTDRTITANYVGIHLNVSDTKTMVVPAHSSSSFQIIVENIGYQGWMVVKFYDENNKYMTERWKGIWMVWPSAAVSVQPGMTQYVSGETVTMNTTLRNTTPENAAWQADVKVTVSDPQNIKIFEDLRTVNFSSSGNAGFISSFIMPSGSKIGTYTIKADVYSGTRLSASGSNSYQHSASQISVTPNLSTLAAGDNIIPFVLNNTGKISVYSGTLDVSLMDPAGAVVYNGNQSFTLGVGQNITFNFPITMPSLKFGNYTLTYTQSDETRTGQASTTTLPNSSSVGVSMEKAIYKIGETANITIALNNSGKFKQDGTLTIAIPFLGFSDSKTISVNPSETSNILYSLLLPVTLNSGGDITATFITASGNQLTKTLPLSISSVGVDHKISFDKSSYKIRENLGLNYTLTNNGNFASPVNASLSISIPDVNYTYNNALMIEPGKAIEIPFTIPIPETISAGKHNITTSVILPSGAVHQANFSFTIPESSLEIASPSLAMTGQTTLTAGDTINLTIENTGGVDTNYTTEKLSITDSKGVAIFQGNVTDAILAGEKKILTDIQIPSQTVNGFAFLNIQIKDSKTSKPFYLYKILAITGLTATLEMRTDKDIYLKTETITGLSSISNGQFGVENGSLKVNVSKINPGVQGYFSHFLPKDSSLPVSMPYGVAVGPDSSIYVTDINNHRIQKFSKNGDILTQWGSYGNIWYGGSDGQFNSPMGIAIGVDGSVYVADAGNCRIQKFDSNGNFIAKWGSYGSNNGQFNYPRGVAISSDGSIYVADTKNHRIQKFDSNGNFIAKWGSNGSNNGQFNYPYGVAVAPDGSVYVADTANWRFQKFDSNGNFIYLQYEMVDNLIIYPWGIAVGPDGSVYLSDYGSNRILKYDSSGNLISKWGKLGVGDGEFYGPCGVAIGSDGSVYVADTENYRIQRMIEGGIETLFETAIPITQPANTTQDYTTNIGTLNAIGKLYLNAELKNSLGQTIATAEYPFYIVEGNTALFYSTDKKVYKPGETVTITGQVKNLASIAASALSLQLSANSQNIYTETFDIPAGGTHPFIITTTTGSEGAYSLTGKVTQNNSTLVEIADQYEVALPKAAVSVTAPDVTGHEPFNINVGIKNEGKVALSSQLSVVSGQRNTIDNQQITIPAGETKVIQYSQQITTNTTYTFTFTGDIEQTIQKQVVFGEKAALDVNMQPLYKEGAVAIPYTVRNTGVLEAAYPVTFTLFNGEQEISKTTTSFMLPVSGNASGSLSYNLSEGLYTLRSETTGFKVESQISVVKAGQGEIILSINDSYPEGAVNIPYTIRNTGQFDSEITSEFKLGTAATQKSAFISAGGSYAGELQYSLSSGDYTLSAMITSYPSNPVNRSFKVLKENNVTMGLTIGAQTNEFIPVTVNLANLGYNNINGSVQLSAVSSQGTTVWNSEQSVSLPYTLNPIPYTLLFNINPSAIAAGDYTLKAELLNNSNQQIAVSYQPLAISGAAFAIAQLPPYSTFTAGQEATFTFKVKNTGNLEGGVDLNLKSYDLIDSTQTEWLKPGEEKSIAFSFMLPEDIEEKDYFADYALTAGDSPDSTALQAGKSGTVPVKGQVKYHVSGINLSVNATLDKQKYNVGDTAHLQVQVSSSQPESLNLFARVNYAGYESQQAFALTSASILTFDIPLTEITGGKLFYGVYHESGRSIHLNSLYIYKTGDAITITTDKQVYNPGETVTIAISSQQSAVSGIMTLTGPNDYTETFEFTGAANKSFALPSTMPAGTYNISAQLNTGQTQGSAPTSLVTASHPFDVNGIQVKVLECKNDKGKYAASDTITTSLTISSNTAMPATLKALIVDPEGKYTTAGENSINLSASEPLLTTNNYPLATGASGIHRLVYGIYTAVSGQQSANSEMLLVSGSEAFDVGDAVLLGLSTDKADYPTNSETVTVSVSAFGTVDANFELRLDGTTVKSESVTLNGFVTWNLELGTIRAGSHTLKGILTAGGLKSTKETSFVYGSNLPDLRAEVRSQKSEVGKDNTIQIITTITNQGRTSSTETTVSLYDNPSIFPPYQGGTQGGVIETKPVNALNAGESQEITFGWNVLGKAGEHTLKAEVDSENSVIEFNENNNTASINIVVPDITLITETDKDTYKIRQKVNINSFMTNLTAAKTYTYLTIVTSVKDSLNNEAYNSSKPVDTLQSSGSLALSDIWNTSGLPVDGIYTITQSVFSGSLLLTQNSKLITLELAPDFTIRTDTEYRKIKQGARATYATYLESGNGWGSEITLGIEGLPLGTSVSFSPGNLIPPGESLTVIITTDATTAGTHSLTLTAQGTDEGETIIHTLPLTVDVSGFGLSAEPLSKTIKQLETATFDVKPDTMNGYEGEVALSVAGVPFGVRASFDNSNIGVPGNAKLTVLTSKYARPGAYELIVTGDDGLVKHSLDLNLNIDSNPEISTGIIVTPGPGPKNPASVKLLNSELKTTLEFTSFTGKYGANAIMADIDGDGYDEIIVAPGPDPKAEAKIRVYRRNGSFMLEQKIFDAKYGLTLESGDINGDWKDELVVGMGPDPKNPSKVKILSFDGKTFIDTGINFNAFDSRKKGDKDKHNYGVNVAVGDVDGDMIPELIAAPGPGAESRSAVKVFKIDASSEIGSWKISEAYSEFIAFTEHEAEKYHKKEEDDDDEPADYGVNIAAGDVDGDGISEIIAGAGPDPKNISVVKVFKGDGTFTGLSFTAYPDKKAHHKHEEKDSEDDGDDDVDGRYRYGVYVAAGDLNGDGADEIITGAGPGPKNRAWVKVFRSDGAEIYSFISYPENVKYGVKVSKGNIGD